MYDTLREIASMILLLMLIVLGNLIAAALLKWARQHDKRKQQQKPRTCSRRMRPTSNSSDVCGKPLAAHADSDGWGVCPVHGLVRETMS